MEDSYGELPERHVTAGQLVGYNMARYRKAAGMTGAETGERIGGWTKRTVSAAEHSWDGKRARSFDAAELVAIAAALRVPVAGLLLPPEDDGREVRYVLDFPARPPLSMHALMTLVMSEPTLDDEPVMTFYRQRYVMAMAAYLDPARAHELTGDTTALRTEDDVTASQGKLEQQREAFRNALRYLGEQEIGLTDRLAEIRREQ